jgi:NTP pyrophosphatase (non-canonical NTP hydrolase)
MTHENDTWHDRGSIEYALSKIDDESRFQIEKWGMQDRYPEEWLMFLTEEVGELAKAISEWKYREGSQGDIANEAVQVATLAIKIASFGFGKM